MERKLGNPTPKQEGDFARILREKEKAAAEAERKKVELSETDPEEGYEN